MRGRPFSHNGSLSYDKMLAEGWLVGTLNTSEPEPPVCPANNLCPSGLVTLPDGLHGGLVDVTNPRAREYVWSRVNEGYAKHGIRIFWLDGSVSPLPSDNPLSAPLVTHSAAFASGAGVL